jgi:excisionase family DNA binding protein
VTSRPTPMEVLAALDVLRRWFADGASAPPSDTWVDSAACEVPQRTIRDAVRRGELQASRAGKRLLVRRSHLDAWLEGRRASPRPRSQPSAKIIELGGRRRT